MQLESNQGLAAIAQGQAGAGMYNSTTNKPLTNDLLADRLISQRKQRLQLSLFLPLQTAKVANSCPSLKATGPNSGCTYSG